MMRHMIWMRHILKAQVCAAALGIACAASAAAEPVLLVHDAQGRLLRQAPAVLRARGEALIAREALYGASSAVVMDDAHALNPVLWVLAEDRDSGVLRVYVGAQAPPGPDRAVAAAVVQGTSGGHACRAGEGYK